MAGSPLDQNAVFVHDNSVPPVHNSLFSLFSLKGKTAIVTGGGAGIGLAVAQGLAEAGANIALFYNTNDKAPERAAEIEKQYGVKAKAYQADLRDQKKAEATINEAVKDFNGRLDVFIANAGIPWTKGATVDGPIQHYLDVVQTDLDATWYCARAAAAHWRRQKEEGTDLNGNKLENFTYGSFVATASMSGHIVNIPQLQAPYNAAKAGVRHLVKSLSVEWPKFARANTISPGYIATEISNFIPKETHDLWKSKIPMGREGMPEELKGAFLYLASDASSYTTGTDIIVDGGYCAP
ncbi:uncharacterized protein BHQ10_004801 [Talaromyces amestolkiae]|uniref:Uncharacterized protein n=1 Tax=Talaromyces amestolkiae TaxID=1196081 RepID=A0A364KZ22_TALAM|nr:uncharacterized protein BHQ10_004801 [Talaromyces amestolkiae]RAO68789.1 hypothetical protein BHQ10_004801 [Talaromyces amestolkiae]